MERQKMFWYHLMCIISIIAFQSIFAFQLEELKWLNYEVNILQVPVKRGEEQNLPVVHVVSKYGQEYQCVLPQISDDDSMEKDSSNDKHADIKELLAPLQAGVCLTKSKDWWTYELCFGHHIKQFHIEEGKIVGQVLTLGVYESDFDWNNLTNQEKFKNVKQKYHTQYYTNGSKCDLTGQPRTTEVRLYCEEETGDYIHRVDEPGTCNYIFIVYTSRICSHPQLKSIPSNKVNSIPCSPLLNEEQYAKYLQKVNEEKSAASEKRTQWLTDQQDRLKQMKQWAKENVISIESEDLTNSAEIPEKPAADENPEKTTSYENSEKASTDENSEKVTTDESSDDTTHKNSEKSLTNEKLQEVTIDENSQKVTINVNSESDTTDENSQEVTIVENSEDVATDVNMKKSTTNENSEKVTADENSKEATTDENSKEATTETAQQEASKSPNTKFKKSYKSSKDRFPLISDDDNDEVIYINPESEPEKEVDDLEKEFSVLKQEYENEIAILKRYVPPADFNVLKVELIKYFNKVLDNVKEKIVNDAAIPQVDKERTYAKLESTQTMFLKKLDEAEVEVMEAEKKARADYLNGQFQEVKYEFPTESEIDPEESENTKILLEEDDDDDNTVLFTESRTNMHTNTRKIIKHKANINKDEKENTNVIEDDNNQSLELDDDKLHVRIRRLNRNSPDSSGQLHEMDLVQRKKLEEAVKEKLEKAGLDTGGRRVEVKIITAGYYDNEEGKDFHMLSDDETNQFQNMIMALLTGQQEAVQEMERQKKLEANYKFTWEDEEEEEKKNQE